MFRTVSKDGGRFKASKLITPALKSEAASPTPRALKTEAASPTPRAAKVRDTPRTMAATGAHVRYIMTITRTDLQLSAAVGRKRDPLRAGGRSTHRVPATRRGLAALARPDHALAAEARTLAREDQRL